MYKNIQQKHNQKRLVRSHGQYKSGMNRRAPARVLALIEGLRLGRLMFRFGECMEFKEIADNLGLEENEFKEIA